MGAYDELIDEYLGTALSPEEMRDLALLQVKNASVQDDAVQNAVANHQGLERANRSALEEYLIAQEQQAAAESQKAKEMAQQRLNAIDNNIALLSSTVGLGKEGKRQLSAYNSERKSILDAFPELGKAENEQAGKNDGGAFSVEDMLKSGDFSPENIAKFYELNDWDEWDKALRTGNLDLYQALLDGKLGQMPEGMAAKMRYTIAGMPETSGSLKLDDRYARLRDVIGETQGDIKKKNADAKAAAKKKKEDEELNKLLEEYAIEKDRALSANNDFAREPFKNKEFAKKMKALKENNKLSGEELNKLVRILGYEL